MARTDEEGTIVTVRYHALIAAALMVLGGCQSDLRTVHPMPDVPLGGPPGAMGTPDDVSDLLNSLATDAEPQLGQRGYKRAKQQGLTSYWWNPKTKVCTQSSSQQRPGHVAAERQAERLRPSTFAPCCGDPSRIPARTPPAVRWVADRWAKCRVAVGCGVES